MSTPEFRPAEFNAVTADAATITSVFETPTFPFTITVNNVSVTLKADGTWDGDLPAFRAAVAGMKGQIGDGGLLVWLVLRQMIRDDERFW